MLINQLTLDGLSLIMKSTTLNWCSQKSRTTKKKKKALTEVEIAEARDIAEAEKVMERILWNVTISIIGPFKDAAIFLKSCIDSICRQSHDSWQLIAIDDHSEDHSRATSKI